MISSRNLARFYSGVSIIKTTGFAGLPCLCAFIVSYGFPGALPFDTILLLMLLSYDFRYLLM